MGDWGVDTRVQRNGDRFSAQLSKDWDVWGPVGGYRAAIALRAMATLSRFPRPASFACHFVRTGAFGPVELDVTSVWSGKRAESLRVTMSQDGKTILEATAWMVDHGMEGFEHEITDVPVVAAPESLKGYQDVAANYADWYPFWRSVEGRPTSWEEEVSASLPPEARSSVPIWRTWMRVCEDSDASDLVADAGRAVLWIDLVGWNAVTIPHGYPPKYIAPNLDLTVQFHQPALGETWLLCDGHAPVARDGLVGTTGRVWTTDGRLIASGTAQLICKPSPFVNAAKPA